MILYTKVRSYECIHFRALVTRSTHPYVYYAVHNMHTLIVIAGTVVHF